ncbi:hypothetical protein VOLCADRAFT_108140 [Volvox carteri f. nagariensis]|uniref:Transcription factor CBF/NF-Y/archaeal histone domain-containing protein n=1 Tax=Volvox carteri f. nagariensis TaxID=3068 RepID=D8UIH7_VOLCA|nr:uncharacterized protein VOLCADRAFT_108140 [Volvox carteri f. nagariensis]EFJ40477.1 hypothetical protein VOLCADRAFT_108140 [Volvox carteri f. nagariensis]|eukprot:XP_002958477.1 hypothetical protein VOLCADRAFT_108140 [Volvox carteri f. nagariensis]
MADDIGLPGGAEGLDLGRVKRIMQVEARCMTVNPESTFLVCRAAELFLDALIARSNAVMEGKTELEYHHVAQAVQGWQSAQFLTDIVPTKIQAGQLRSDPRFQGKGAVTLPLQFFTPQQQQQHKLEQQAATVPSPLPPPPSQKQPKPVAQPPLAAQQPQQVQQQPQQQPQHFQQLQQQQQILLQAQLQQQQMEAQQQLLRQHPYLWVELLDVCIYGTPTDYGS